MQLICLHPKYMNRDAISEYLEFIKNEIKTTTLITTELDRLINTLIDIKKEDDLFVHGLANAYRC